MTEWFKNQEKPSQSVIGRDLSQGTLTVSKDGGNVDAITASTITSRAFLEAINKAYLAYSGSKEDAHSGTTEKKITESSSDKSGRIKEEEKNNE
jgi:electron transport complex protein RnfG